MSPSGPEPAWERLVSAALLGTERRPEAPSGPPLLDEIGAVAAGPEVRLLAAAGVLAVARRAGRPVPVPPPGALPPPAPVLDRPEAPPDAAATLDLLLGGPFRRLLPEWLGACAAGSWRVPSTWLPAVLDAAAADPLVRAAAGPALGDRGRWLAGLEPRWGPAAGPPPPAAWPEATSDERVAIVRAAGADQALALVRSTWEQDGAVERARLLRAAADLVTPAWEPFLEEVALVDGRGEVRSAAADALDRLPGSRRAARMAARAAGLVDLARRRVHLPDDVPDDWAADGVERRAGRGARLAQVVAAAPLGSWGDPGEALAAVGGADHEDTLVAAWAAAARNQRNRAWAERLAPHRLLPAAERAPLLALLDPAARHLAVAARLGDGPLGLALAAAAPGPWPPGLAVGVWAAAQRSLDGPGRDRQAREALAAAAERADPADLPALLSAPRDARRWHLEEEALAVAEVRLGMLRQLAPRVASP